MTDPFRGFPAEALTFYERLEADNTKTFWHAHKAEYDAAIKAPLGRLLAELEPEFGRFHTFRPYNDVRFSKDKTPYKTHTGSLAEGEGGTIYYVQLSAKGLLVGSGYYHMAADQLIRFRAAVDDDATGAELTALTRPLVKAGFALSSIGELKTAPRGYSKDHPRIEFLRRKGLIAMRTFTPAAWLHSAQARVRIVGAWHAAEPVCRWLDAHVGPSELPPDDRFR